MIDIIHLFYCMGPTNRISQRDRDAISKLDIQDQKKLLEATVISDLCKKHPPSVPYRKSFIKFLLSKLESNNTEVCDELYEVLGDLMSTPEASSFCYKSYFYDKNCHITLKESQQLISNGTTGLCTWQAAQYLGEWVLDNLDHFHDMRVLELGSGLGFTGILLTRCSTVKQMTFTDCHEKVLSLLRENIALNLCKSCSQQLLEVTYDGYCQCKPQRDNQNYLPEQDVGSQALVPTLASKIQISHLDWEQASLDDMTKKFCDINIIIASDVVYDESIIPSLVKVLYGLLSGAKSRKAYICSTVRNQATNDTFISSLDSACISYKHLTTTPSSVFQYDKSTPIQLLELQVL